jgi:hypothetical protein
MEADSTMSTLRKVTDIGQIAFLRTRKIEMKDIKTFDNRSVCFFDNEDFKTDKALADYFSSPEFEFYNTLNNTRKFLFQRHKDKIESVSQ